MLALASVRGRKASFVGTVAALVLGVALLTMTLLVYASSLPTVPDRVSRAAVLVHGPQIGDGVLSDFRPWPADEVRLLTQRLGAVDGVGAAIPDRTFYAQLVDRPGSPRQGHGWSSSRLGGYPLSAGRAPETDGELAVDAGLGVGLGATVEVLFAAGPRPMTVTGLVSGEGLYVSDEAAARLAPGVPVIGLLTDGQPDLSGVDLAGGAAISGADRAVLEPQEVAKTRWLGTQLLSAMAMLGVFVTVFIVASTFALNAAARRRELGLLRTVGATPRQVRRLVQGEALLVGTVGAAGGVAAGAVAAPVLGRLLVRWGLENQDFGVRLIAWPMIAAWLIGVLVGLLGAWSASRRAGRVGALAALHEAAIEQRAMSLGRWVLGGGALAVGGWLSFTTATASAEDRVDAALLTAMALIVAAALLAPIVITPLVRLATWPARRSRGALGLVMRAEMLNAVRRTASTAAPIIAAIGFTALLTGMVHTMQTAYPAGQAATMAGSSIVVPDGTPGLSAQAVSLAGPARSLLVTEVFVGDELLEAAGDSAVTQPTEVVAAGLPVGSTVAVTFADGVTVPLRVASGDSGDFDLLLPRELVRAHDPSALTPYVFGGTLAGAGARLVDAQEYAEMEYAEDSRLLWLFAKVLIGLSVGYTGISILNTMAMANAGRRHDFTVLRSAGATTRQVLRFVAAETALVVALGVGLGLLVTVPPLAGMAAGLAEEMAVPVGLRMHWPTLVMVTLACLALAIASSILTTARILRRPSRG